MPRFVVEESGRVLDVLRRHFPDWKASTLKQRLGHGLVTLNGKHVRSGADPVKKGDALEVLARPVNAGNFFPAKLGEAPLDILYADAELVAVDKPSGLLSVASERERDETAVHLMRAWLASGGRDVPETLHAAHRLDRDASGVLLLARTLEVKRRLAAAWHTFEKTYLAVTDGIPREREGIVDVPLREDKALFVRPAEPGAGEAALTTYRVTRTAGNRALIEVGLGTGRKHQIRVHLASLGCPIFGDIRYGVSKARRLALHAHRLRFTHPVDGRTVTVTSPVPAFLRRELAKGASKKS